MKWKNKTNPISKSYSVNDVCKIQLVWIELCIYKIFKIQNYGP